LLAVFYPGGNPMQFMEKLKPLTLLLLRVGLGVVFMHNGYVKLSGRRQEPLDELLHINPNHLSAHLAYFAAILELAGGTFLVAGLFTRAFGLLLTAEMAFAMWKSEQFFQNPLAVDRYELALLLVVGAFALATFGAGSISLDQAFFGKGKSGWAAKSSKSKS
jgi:putative oxidoreductase